MGGARAASTDPIRTLVVDDEPEAREGVLDLLRADPEVAVVGECGAGVEAAHALAALAPELALLDVHLPDLDAFDVLARVAPERWPVVVFVTAHDAYAVRAFEAHAVDYLLKPFTDARFAAALAAAKARVRERRVGVLGQQLAALLREVEAAGQEADDGAAPAAAPTPPAPAPPYLDRILVRLAGSLSFVRVPDVDWIGAADYYAELHVEGRTHLVREPLQQLERQLDPARFVRVHRSAIVNVDRVQTIQPYIRGSHVLLLRDGTRLVLSRTRRAALERALGWPP